MANKPCLDCGKLSPGTRCPDCRRARDRQRNATRPHYQGDYQRRRAALKATATHCWICREPLTGEPWPSPRSTTADHVVPGDPSSELRAAHLACNSSRGARANPA